MYYLRLLGSLSLEKSPGAAAVSLRPRPLAVLAFLAVAGGKGCSRDKLIGYFWPEVEPERARHRLTDAVYLIHKSLGSGSVAAVGDSLCLNRDVVESDLARFLGALHSDELERAVQLYSGPFLDGFYLSGVPEFERWVESERQRFADAYADAIERLGEQAESRCDYRGAVGWYKRLADHDAYNSRVILRLGRALAAAGDPANALESVRAHEQHLRDDLGLELPEELVAFAEGLRGKSVTAAAPGGEASDSVEDGRVPAAQLPRPKVRDTAHARAGREVVVRRWSLDWRIAGLSLVAVLALWAIGAVGWLLFGERSGEAAAETKSVAVLPFVNLSDDSASEYFSDGITGDIITHLARIGDLKVTSRRSAMSYKFSDKSLRQIGEELGVKTIVEGDVRRSGDRIRINAQLIEAETDSHLWAEQYDSRLEDVFDIQSDIAERVAAALQARMAPAVRAEIERRPTNSVQAYGYYLRAIDYLDRSDTEEDTRSALAMVRAALELDSEFAQAWALLSELHSRAYWFYWDRSDERLTKARTAAERALEVDPDLAEGHVSLGLYHYRGYLDYDHALAELALAQQKLPGQSRVWAAIGWIKRRQGKFNDAVVDMTKAFELDPRSASIAYNIADTHRYLRDFAEAERWYERASLLNPDWLGPYWRKALLYVAWEGDTTEARAVLDEWRARADSTYRDYTIEFLWARRYSEALEWLSANCSEFFQAFPDLNDARIPKELECARVSAFLNRPQQAFAYYDSARAVLEAKLLDRPNDERLHSALGIAYAGLGRKESAIRQGRIGVALMPLEKEAAWKGLSRLEQLAQIYTLVGEYDAAIDELEHLLSIPSWVTVPLLRIDPTYDPLRDYPRFQKLLEEYE